MASIAAFVPGRKDGVLRSSRASSTTPSELRNIEAREVVLSAVTYRSTAPGFEVPSK
jgi:hypothetical protein